jgi:UDP-N-acetylmuramoyl-L-alanyl-D-glutamate--2,6-diaminopimelate ligase
MVHSDSGIVGIVDYAHTPDALENVLKTINEVKSQLPTANCQLITVVGCGGNRDASKRPEMAAIAVKLSDRVILTSDNPRNEDPEEIIRQMKVGILSDDLSRVLSITDRREAIRTAVALARKNDVILLAGKGHEDYQIIKGEKRHFDDKEELAKALKEK